MSEPRDETNTGATQPAQAPQQAQPQQPAQSQPVQPRPAQPEYGEYAPEGWEWKPEGSDAAPQAAAPSNLGVPHNLGAPAAAGATGATGTQPQAHQQQQPNQQQAQPFTQQPGDQQAYRAAAPQPGPVYGMPGAPRPRTGDRIITIILLVFGAFGALSVARSFFGLESQISLMGTLIGMDEPKVASWVGTLGMVSALVVLLVWALNLLFSIQRMRARKITFWVPLVAAVIAFIIVMVVPMIAMNGAPEIMQQIEADPNGALSKMLESLQEMQQP
ncbi:DUF6264 family protein [Leucobacter chromiireducens]|uniref:Uncharacterized protein n=1 Tax=Leucobacter chromiireducens subsp. chromiireducens TaxID=660067 RepID=A0ABS1SND5_9MICO|nr:hypothetical protein [Leucobacter chromiireducens subsp. chromiireducens]